MRTSLSPHQFVIACALTLSALVTPVAAQRTAGPYSGVLGAEPEDNARHTLEFRGSGYGVWEDVTDNAEAAAPDNRFLRSGFGLGADAGLTHARRSQRLQWQSWVDSVFRIYGAGDDGAAATFSGRSTVSSTLNSRVTVSGSGSWSYSPYFELAPEFGTDFQSVGSFGGGFGVATAAERNILAEGRGGVSVRLSRRDTFDVDVFGRNHDFLDQPSSSVTSFGGGGMFRHQLTRSLGLHAGFGREEARYAYEDGRNVVSDRIDVGVDYGDTLEFAERTALSFGFSTSMVRWDDDTHFRLNGSATLSRAFGRTGSAMVQYNRDTEFNPAFVEPLLTDTISGGFSDQIGRRTSWTANAAYVHGDIGFGSAAGDFNAYNAGGRITTALTRHFGIFGDYSYYRYSVPPGSTVLTSIPRFTRQSFSVGLTVWAPLVQDTRAPGPVR